METEECIWCGKRLELVSGPGRSRVYCGDAHKSAAYRFKKRTPNWVAMVGFPLMHYARQQPVKGEVAS